MDGIDLMLKHNDEQRQLQIDVLLGGGAKDYAEYKHICGVIRGLDLADANIRDLAQRMKDNDDSD